MTIKTENSGGHCEYYHCEVTHPQNPNQSAPYIANCEDIIQALGLTFDEGCEFKSIWRRGRGRQGFVKAESTPLRDAVKAVHYANRVLSLEERRAALRLDEPEASGKPLYSCWDRLPTTLKWIATDPDGEVYAYEMEPSYSAREWKGNPGKRTVRIPDEKAPPVEWRASLERRP